MGRVLCINASDSVEIGLEVLGPGCEQGRIEGAAPRRRRPAAGEQVGVQGAAFRRCRRGGLLAGSTLCLGPSAPFHSR